MDLLHDLLPNVQIIKKLGSNALGVLYQVQYPEFGECCCKLFVPEKTPSKPNPEKKKLLDKCLLSLKNLQTNSPYISKIYQYDEANGQYLLRNFSSGMNLEQFISKNQSLELSTINHIMEQVLEGVQTLHAYELTYKNLKPSNIIISPEQRVQLVDFSLPPTTPYCLSPEQCSGKKSEIPSDIYALGVIYYFCLLGHYPFEQRLPKDVMQAHKEQACPNITDAREDVTSALNDLIRKMLSKHPADRPESCEAILQQLSEMGMLATNNNLDVPLSPTPNEQLPDLSLDVPNLSLPQNLETPIATLPTPQPTVEGNPNSDNTDTAEFKVQNVAGKLSVEVVPKSGLQEPGLPSMTMEGSTQEPGLSMPEVASSLSLPTMEENNVSNAQLTTEQPSPLLPVSDILDTRVVTKPSVLGSSFTIPEILPSTPSLSLPTISTSENIPSDIPSQTSGEVPAPETLPVQTSEETPAPDITLQSTNVAAPPDITMQTLPEAPVPELLPEQTFDNVPATDILHAQLPHDITALDNLTASISIEDSAQGNPFNSLSISPTTSPVVLNDEPPASDITTEQSSTDISASENITSSTSTDISIETPEAGQPAAIMPPATESQVQEKIAKLKQVASDMTNRLKVVNQTLGMLEDVQGSQGLEAILFIEEMLRFITSKIGELLNVDRTIIFLVDEERNELLPIMDKREEFSLLEFRIPSNEGLVGKAIADQKPIKIGYDCYHDQLGNIQMKLDEQMHYRTYTTLCLPVVTRGKSIAVLQFLNKLKPNISETKPLKLRIDQQGFQESDEELFHAFLPSLRVILDASNAFYRATQRMRAASSLMSSIQTLSHSSLDLNESLRKVMDEARRLIEADRMTIWLLDSEKEQLWANIQMSDGTIKEIRIPQHAGFAGKVVATQQPLLIPFDLYDHPDSTTAKNTDRTTGYRTCSIMCLPIFNLANQLIGVTQLVNKRRKGEFPAYNHQDWPKAPDCWKTSFSSSDMQFIQAFNIQAGVTIQNATMFAKIKQQEQMQRDILRSLANGVISVNKTGHIITINESGRRILGIAANEAMEQRDVRSLIHIKDQPFGEWLDLALGRDANGQAIPPHETSQDDILLVLGDGKDGRSINISIHTIKDAKDNTTICGALVVMEDLSKEKRIRNMMCRYMSNQIVDQLLASHDIQLGGQLKDVTVMFSDIRSYTTITEGMKAEEVVAMLNEYFELMVGAVFHYQGTLDKYIGDALMAVFGSPMPLPDHGWNAVRCSLEMREQLAKFNEARALVGKPPIKIGMGIHTDTVVSGNIGCSRRMEFTSIGDGVNLASRLESITKQYGCDLVISEETYKRCEGRIHVRELDLIIVKGKTQAVKIYEVIGLREIPLTPEQQECIELYEKARKLYSSREFVEALAIFKELVERHPKDGASTLHQERCLHFIAEPPPENWDGVWTYHSK